MIAGLRSRTPLASHFDHAYRDLGAVFQDCNAYFDLLQENPAAVARILDAWADEQEAKQRHGLTEKEPLQ